MTAGKNAKPTIKRRRIGALLRQYREQRAPKILSRDAARHIGVDPVLLGRIERGEYRVKPDQISALLDLYGIEDPVVHTELRRSAMEPLDTGWWYPYRNKLIPEFLDFITLENEATKIKDVVAAGIPGLLQCLAYAQEIQETSSQDLIREDADLYVQIRLSRQQVINRRKDPAELHCVMAETALHSESASMAEQIAHMISMSRRENVTLQVMPLSAPIGMHINVQATQLTFRDPWTSVAYTPGLSSGVVQDGPLVTKNFDQRFSVLAQHALPEDRTRELLEERLKKINHEH